MRRASASISRKRDAYVSRRAQRDAELMFDTPVTLFIFNRPHLTARVWAAIRQMQPSRLFVVADGPRAGHSEDVENCAAARAVIETIDWQCELVKNYSEVNFRPGPRIKSGICWVFEHADEAIFLEDDVLPDPTFFLYCAELLRRYRDEERIAMICGQNPFGAWGNETCSYFFTRTACMWGWAGWKRAWLDNDFEFKGLAQSDIYPQILKNFGDAAYASFQMEVFERAARGERDAWDLQFALLHILRGALIVTPGVNLVSNLGFGPHATHTRLRFSMTAELERHAMQFPLRAPPQMEADDAYDKQFMAWSLGHPDLALVLARAEQELAAQRHARALLWLQGAMRAGLARTALERTRLMTLQARALYALGQPERARRALREALHEMPVYEPAQRLSDARQG